jgi:hypothetical protein
LAEITSKGSLAFCVQTGSNKKKTDSGGTSAPSSSSFNLKRNKKPMGLPSGRPTQQQVKTHCIFFFHECLLFPFCILFGGGVFVIRLD